MYISIGDQLVEINDKIELEPVDKIPTDDPNKVVYLLSAHYIKDDRSMFFNTAIFKTTIKDVRNTFSKDVYVEILANKQTSQNVAIRIYLVEDKV